jgi:hypothetical protein
VSAFLLIRRDARAYYVPLYIYTRIYMYIIYHPTRYHHYNTTLATGQARRRGPVSESEV